MGLLQCTVRPLEASARRGWKNQPNQTGLHFEEERKVALDAADPFKKRREEKEKGSSAGWLKINYVKLKGKTRPISQQRLRPQRELTFGYET